MLQLSRHVGLLPMKTHRHSQDNATTSHVSSFHAGQLPFGCPNTRQACKMYFVRILQTAHKRVYSEKPDTRNRDTPKVVEIGEDIIHITHDELKGIHTTIMITMSIPARLGRPVVRRVRMKSTFIALVSEYTHQMACSRARGDRRATSVQITLRSRV